MSKDKSCEETKLQLIVFMHFKTNKTCHAVKRKNVLKFLVKELKPQNVADLCQMIKVWSD